MFSAGELLRSEREKRNRSLWEISVETRISARILEALENNDVAALPGHFFHRSFICQYARALGLDDAVTSDILAALAPKPDVGLPYRLRLHFAELERRARPLARVSARFAAVLLVAVSAGGSGVYALWNQAQEAKLVQPTALVGSGAPAQAVPMTDQLVDPTGQASERLVDSANIQPESTRP